MNDATDAGAAFRQRLDEVAADIESLLDRLLGAAPLAEERARPQRLMDSMRYASLGGGKRLRPFLVAETAALFKVPRERALMAGAALECVHCYSLAHDDLPAMDNDDLRRGRPTAHKKFDDATAILAGDGLLTLAFDILARPETHPSPAVRIDLVLALARASGLGGMVGGQMLDLAAEGPLRRRQGAEARRGRREAAANDEDRRAVALRLPRGRDPRRGDAARSARRSTATARCSAKRSRSPTICSMSKAMPRPSARQPARMRPPARAPSSRVLGMDGAKARLKTLVAESEQALAPFGRDGDVLKMAARFVAERKA